MELCYHNYMILTLRVRKHCCVKGANMVSAAVFCRGLLAVAAPGSGLFLWEERIWKHGWQL